MKLTTLQALIDSNDYMKQWAKIPRREKARICHRLDKDELVGTEQESKSSRFSNLA
jgi:hypothetical protein